MKKFFILQIVVVSFLVLSCKNFLSENSLFASKMAEEVSYATATEVFVTVSEPTEGSTKYGNMIKGSRDVKVGFPFEIEYELAKEEGYFCYWEAFENYSANKTNTPITDTEIIEFEDIYKNPTKVTLKKEVQNIRIIPKINKTPMINIESPDYGTSSLTGETKLLPGETIPVVISSFDQYGITNLKITSRDISKEIISSLDLRTIESFSESVLLKDSKEHILFTLTNLRVSSNLSTVSFILEAGSGLDAVYNLGADFAPRPQIDATSNVPSQSEGVMRTTPIKIKFTNEMDVSLITAENYKEFISISRVKENPETSEETIYDCFSDSEYNDKSYFSVPEFLSDKKTLLISPVNKLDKAEWLPSGSKLRVTISESLCDINSVPMLNKYSFAFTLGTEGDAEGPIITNEKTSLSIVSSEKEISQSEWGDFEPSKNAKADHTYADSIHVGPGESFKAVIQASDLSTGDTGIKEFVADIRLMYVSEGGRLPNSSETASKNLILFDKDGNWLYESGFLKQDFYKEKSLTYSGTNKIADTESDFIFDFEDFITDETSGSLSVDGIYRIALTAKDALDNYSTNPNVYYVVRDTTAPDAEENIVNLDFSENDTGVLYNNNKLYCKKNKKVGFKFTQDIKDLGQLLLPTVGSHTNKWSISLSSSKVNCDESNIVYEWSEFLETSEEIEITLPDYLFDDGNNILYPWVKFIDDRGNISKCILAKDNYILIDVESPEKPIFVKGENPSDFVYFDDLSGILWVGSCSKKYYFSSTDLDLSGLDILSGYKIKFKTGSDIFEGTPEYENGLLTSYSFKFTKGKSYEIYSEDALGNKSADSLFYKVDEDTDSPEIEITSLHNFNNDTNVTGIVLDSVYKRNETRTLRCNGYTNGTISLGFNITEKGTGIQKIYYNGFNVLTFKYTNVPSNFTVSHDSTNKCFILEKNGIATFTPVYNLKFEIKGEIDSNEDGLKIIKISTMDLVNSSQESDSIILDTTPPEMYIKKVQNGIRSSDPDSFQVASNYTSGGSVNEAIQTVIRSNENGVGYVYYKFELKTAHIENKNYLAYYDRNYYQVAGTTHRPFATSSSEIILPERSNFSLSELKISDYHVEIYGFAKDTSQPYIEFYVTAIDALGNTSKKQLFRNEYDNVGPVIETADSVSKQSDTLYYYYDLKGCELTVKDSGSGLETGTFTSIVTEKSPKKEKVLVTSDNPTCILTDFSTDGSGTQYKAVLFDKFGKKTEKQITVVNKTSCSPEITFNSFDGTLYQYLDNTSHTSLYNNGISNVYKDYGYLVFTINDKIGLKENGITIPGAEIIGYRIGSSNATFISGDNLIIENEEGVKYIKCYVKLKSNLEDMIVCAENINGNKSTNWETVKRDTFGPKVTFDYSDPNTSLSGAGNDYERRIRMTDGSLYVLCYCKYTGTAGATMTLNVSDEKGDIYDERSNSKITNGVPFDGVGMNYGWLEAESSSTSTTITKINKSQYKISGLLYKGVGDYTLYYYNVYDSFGNKTRIEIRVYKN